MLAFTDVSGIFLAVSLHPELAVPLWCSVTGPPAWDMHKKNTVALSLKSEGAERGEHRPRSYCGPLCKAFVTGREYLLQLLLQRKEK